MKKIFILMLFALNMLCFHQAMASSPIDQAVIIYAEDEKSGGEKGEDGDAKEEDCE